jgi:hypothetical protein
MPEAQTYNFSHKELLELLIRASNVHEGDWMLQMNFGFTAGNFGSNEESVLPGAISLVNSVGITRAPENAPKALVLDAAKINPRTST